MKMVILIAYSIAAWSLSNVSEGVLAMSNSKSIVKAGLYDTLGIVNGKIVDSISNEPIPFATLTFHKDDAGSKTIVSNEKGEFSIDIKNISSKVQLSAMGYRERTYYLASEHSNLLKLIPANNILPSVIVSSPGKKKSNAYWIIKKVNKQTAQNYGDISFDQKFIDYSVTRNYDSIKGETTDMLDLHFYKDDKLMRARKWHKDTANYDVAFFDFIRLPALVLGDIIPKADIIRKGMVIGEKRSENFDFRLLAHYRDKNYGAVYLVSFKPHSNNTYSDFYLRGIGIGSANMPLGYLKGEMLIKDDDYAVISLKYILELQVERFNAAVVDFYHSLFWKANSEERIISNSRIYKYEYSYIKDTLTRKYFVQSIKADCYNTGYQIGNLRKVQLYYQFNITSLGIENIVE